MNVSGAIISKAAHDRIVEAALNHADEQGYCSEVEDFLEALGFSLPEAKPVEVTLTLTVTPENGRNGRASLTDRYNWNLGHEYADVEFKSVEVK